MKRRKLDFVLCACGLDGIFRDAEGNEGPDVASKSEAIAVLDMTLACGILSTDEAIRLLALVRGSGMSEKEQDVPPPLRRKVRDWECMRRATNGRLPFASFHETLNEPGPI